METGSRTTVTEVARRPYQPIGDFVGHAFPKIPQVFQEALTELAACHVLEPVALGRDQLTRIGTAVDYQVRARLDCFRFRKSVALRGIKKLIAVREYHDFSDIADLFLSKYPAMWAEAMDDELVLSRMCLSLAYFDPIYRCGAFAFPIPYRSLEEFMDWPDDEVSEVLRLSRTAVTCLEADGADSLIGNPEFGNSIIAGDGDLIADGCLVELKVAVDPRRELRYWLYQLLLYVLLDHRNKYEMTSIGLLLPRQQKFMKWNLNDIGISDMPLDLLRRAFILAEREHAIACLGWGESDAQAALPTANVVEILAELLAWFKDKCDRASSWADSLGTFSPEPEATD